MLDSRYRGLLALHGCVIVLVLPLLFYVLALVGVEFAGRLEYELINWPLYMTGLVSAGAIFFNFYTLLGPSVSAQDRARVFQVTNLQIFILVLILFAIIFATKDKAISRVFIGLYLVCAYLILFSLNMFLPGWLSRYVLGGKNTRSCLVVGTTASCSRIAGWLRSKQSLGIEVIGLLNYGETEPQQIDIPLLGDVSRLRETIREQGVNQIILLETRHSKEWVKEILEAAEEEGCQILIFNPWAEYFDYPLISVKDGPHTFFTLREEPLESPLNRMIKRLLDLSIAVPVVFLVLPVMIPLVWFFHRRESPGPVFFKQVRRGYNRREFVLYKFRTMHVRRKGDEARQATRHDPRVFHFGEFMRRTSLDELPQFINVLKGEMSVVGPRPHLPEHDRIFSQDVKIYPQRHFVKPGLTGLAQCKGFRGEITDVELLRQRVHYDLEYINEWSVWMDIEIILRTVHMILRPPSSAY
ncbi:exopolysaccharide biosynthesis polyprenyl glycosylphosphotransferase [Ruficoccus amylovorans]|uniref:Exopolysaccharide biosynthesis polyprenyl glycosylphosphotransferase n=1 Tax=Ruficoccus amylovorans TaxID=1804625 RepID=A0A842HDL9_9BACT|nr:exopolysaccharide biosynthesis polyprenyl glycosylphosphotransferase [Ruficoccus amylovorans]MBC2594532.1 exopolysaccharide biosynthesis polyprenyl glycosylphosphotransferase [Ruficoccus amylovorans]